MIAAILLCCISSIERHMCQLWHDDLDDTVTLLSPCSSLFPQPLWDKGSGQNQLDAERVLRYAISLRTVVFSWPHMASKAVAGGKQWKDYPLVN